MRLTPEQIRDYEEHGVLVVPDVFTADEVAAIRGALDEDGECEGPHRVMEDDGLSVRGLYASHLRHPAMERLTRSPRLLEPARQLVDDDVYVMQFKVNTKRGFGGGSWTWHQDYFAWLQADGLESPRATSMTVFLTEVTEFNGPIFFVPGSQAYGVIDPRPRGAEPTSAQHVDPKDLELAAGTVGELVDRHGIVAPKGAAGSLLIFHPNVAHASSQNISPFSRDLLIVTYNALDNAPPGRGTPRPEYLIARPPDTGLEPVEDSMLVTA
ncbi:MAG TPA: phytanoyl-CoA dioxygenase family protein [Solirubrobacteraceae bacterium]|nr:phytanoyl-CoA dioxygenase family protein [Solirubrobacteraceae bacterium]